MLSEGIEASGGTNNDRVRRIQMKCLEILDIVDGICRKNGISYSLCGGSAVGAHLYRRCLAWDDDIDLMMTRENYNRFVGVIQNELPIGYTANEYRLTDDFTSTFTKIIDDNTTVVQKDGTVTGVFLDITVYDRVPDGFLMYADVLLWKLSQIVMLGRADGGGMKNRLRNLALATALRDRARYLRFFQKWAERLGKTKDYSYAELFGAYCNTKKFPRDIFENYSEIEFEGRSCEIVRDYVRYLEIRYDRTDFFEPEEKQVSPHYEFADTQLPYRDYIDRAGIGGDCKK